MARVNNMYGTQPNEQKIGHARRDSHIFKYSVNKAVTITWRFYNSGRNCDHDIC